MVMLMVRAGYSRKEIIGRIYTFETRYPDWKHNAYISRLPRLKRMFVSQAGKRKYLILKWMVWAWDKLK